LVTALVGSVADPGPFRSGRHFSALDRAGVEAELEPRQLCRGGRQGCCHLANKLARMVLGSAGARKVFALCACHTTSALAAAQPGVRGLDYPFALALYDKLVRLHQ
jgi:hypothetical protein